MREIKPPDQLADEAKDLLAQLLETRSYAEATLLLLGALMKVLTKQEMDWNQTIDQLGRIFSARYLRQPAAHLTGEKRCRSRS